MQSSSIMNLAASSNFIVNGGQVMFEGSSKSGLNSGSLSVISGSVTLSDQHESTVAASSDITVTGGNIRYAITGNKECQTQKS